MTESTKANSLVSEFKSWVDSVMAILLIEFPLIGGFTELKVKPIVKTTTERNGFFYSVDPIGLRASWVDLVFLRTPTSDSTLQDCLAVLVAHRYSFRFSSRRWRVWPREWLQQNLNMHFKLASIFKNTVINMEKKIMQIFWWFNFLRRFFYQILN